MSDNRFVRCMRGGYWIRKHDVWHQVGYQAFRRHRAGGMATFCTDSEDWTSPECESFRMATYTLTVSFLLAIGFCVYAWGFA